MDALGRIKCIPSRMNQKHLSNQKHVFPLREPIMPSKQSKKSASKAIQLHNFDLAEVPLNSRVTILGPSGSGKSNFLRSFLFERRNEIQAAVVFSGSEGANAQWEAVCPRAYIYNELDVGALERILHRQEAVTANPPDPRAGNQLTLIFDDLPEADLKLPIMKKLFAMSRHLGIGVFVLIQFATMIPPLIRSNSNYIVVTQTHGEDREKVYKLFFQLFGCKERFHLAMDHFCRNYGQLVLIKQAASPALQDSVKWVKCKVITEPFTVGCREYWAVDEMFALPRAASITNWADVRKSLAQGFAFAGDKGSPVAACEAVGQVGPTDVPRQSSRRVCQLGSRKPAICKCLPSACRKKPSDPDSLFFELERMSDPAAAVLACETRKEQVPRAQVAPARVLPYESHSDVGAGPSAPWGAGRTGPSASEPRPFAEQSVDELVSRPTAVSPAIPTSKWRLRCALCCLAVLRIKKQPDK